MSSDCLPVGWNVLAKPVSIVSCLLHRYIYGVYIKLCKVVLCIYNSVQYGGTPFSPFWYSVVQHQECPCGHVKRVLGQQTVSLSLAIVLEK